MCESNVVLYCMTSRNTKAAEKNILPIGVSNSDCRSYVGFDLKGAAIQLAQ